MKPTMEILERIQNNSRNHPDEIFTRLYRYLLRPDLYFAAYKNLYANKGASTKGVDDDTADGFSKEKVERIIQSLAKESYTPKPARRSYIKKKNSKKQRPLGIPTFTDKLVQEALRLIFEAVYEPTFSPCSHGFRPNRSCHTALKSLKREFTGVSWFIEGDIKGCFDNIDHHTLGPNPPRESKRRSPSETDLEVSQGWLFGGLEIPCHLLWLPTGRYHLPATGKHLSQRTGQVRRESRRGILPAQRKSSHGGIRQSLRSAFKTSQTAKDSLRPGKS